MRKFVWMLPMLLVLLAIAGFAVSKTQKNNSNAEMLQFEDSAAYESVQAVMNDAAFFVKGKMLAEEEYLAGTSSRYKFQLLDDYAGNMRTDHDGDVFYVYALGSAQYEKNKTYYLFLTGFEAYKAGVVMYEPVDGCILQEHQRLFRKEVEIQFKSANSEGSTVEEASFEGELSDFVERNSAEIAAKTRDTFRSDEITSLEAAYQYADAIWKITISSVEEINPEASICPYRIDAVFRGNIETAPEGSIFNGVYPTEAVESGKQYYVLLSDAGNYEYEPFSFDYWLFPAEAPETAALMELLTADQGRE